MPFSAVDTANSISYATNAHYAPQGALSLLQNGGSLVSTMYYNQSGPCRVSVKSSGSAPSACWSVGGTSGNVMDFNYGFGANGNVLAVNNNRDSTRSQTFTYDALNRIATAAASTHSQSSANCWGESFSTDRYGNLTSIGVISSAYNGCTQDNFGVTVSTTTNRFTTSGYCYDTPGNLLGQSNCTTYEYNAENQLVATAGVTYTYDGDGKRVKEDQNSGSTYDRLYWYGLGLDTLFESDLSGNLTYEYIFFGSMRIARRTVSSGAVNYYVSDHLGSSRVVTDSSGSILDDCDFFPYGGPVPSCSSSSGNRYKFTGKERDGESGLDYFVARHYSSWMGRFMQPDEPFADQQVGDPQSWNLYGYVRNNPLNFVDPTGRDRMVCVSGRVGVKDDDGSYPPQCDWVIEVTATGRNGGSGRRGNSGVDLAAIARGATGGGDDFFRQRQQQEQRRSQTHDARANALAKALNATGIQALNPEVCGGGYFVLRGREAEGEIVHGGAWGIVTHDSRSGTSAGFLGEAGVGPFSVGHERSWGVPEGRRESSTFLMAGLGDHVGAFAAFSDLKSPVQVGGYATAFGRGVGGYANLVPGGGCAE